MVIAQERVCAHGVEYRQLSQPAHDGLDFAVAAGERVAIVGASGSGKSSVARLLLRFYDPRQGRVLVGGRDVRTLPLDALRRHVAVVSQDTYLFHGTVEANLRMGRPDATPAELEAAARAANAHGFIATLPLGYRTVVGERGIRLSGGQRQRIAIARALALRPDLVVADEITSGLDVTVKLRVLRLLAELQADFQVAYLWPFARYVIFLALVAILIFLLARAKGWARPVLLILTLVGFAQVCTAVGMAWRRAPEMWEFLLSFPYLFGTVLPLVLNFVALHLLYFSSGKWFQRAVAGR